jgi:hypothetical protein
MSDEAPFRWTPGSLAEGEVESRNGRFRVVRALDADGHWTGHWLQTGASLRLSPEVMAEVLNSLGARPLPAGVEPEAGPGLPGPGGLTLSNVTPAAPPLVQPPPWVAGHLQDGTPVALPRGRATVVRYAAREGDTDFWLLDDERNTEYATGALLKKLNDLGATAGKGGAS